MTPAQAAVILNENVVMHTPVLIKPIVGRELVSIVISISSQSRNDPGEYIFEGKIDAKTSRRKGEAGLRFSGLKPPSPARVPRTHITEGNA
jgi:hypothetical protein